MLALCAVVLQLATSLTHHHPDHASARICGASQDQPARAGCAHASRNAPEHGAPEGACGVCSLLALTRHALEPSALVIAQRIEWHRTPFEDVAAPAPRGNTLLVIRTRGPPRLALT